MLDGICNRIFVLANSNQSSGDRYPEDYFGSLADQARRQGTLDGLARRLRNCMIPGNPRDNPWPAEFSVNKFDQFCRRRARLIVGRVREMVGDSLRESFDEEEDLSDYEE